jgi:hypothetical protein
MSAVRAAMAWVISSRVIPTFPFPRQGDAMVHVSHEGALIGVYLVTHSIIPHCLN